MEIVDLVVEVLVEENVENVKKPCQMLKTFCTSLLLVLKNKILYVSVCVCCSLKIYETGKKNDTEINY